LATILRDYLAKQQVLPGVRSNNETPSWPSTPTSRPIPTSSMNNGGDYVAARRDLLNRYAARWLFALHNLNVSLYGALLYDLSTEISDERATHDDFFLEPLSIDAQKVAMLIIFPLILILINMKAQDVKYFDQILRLIIKLSQTSVAFTVFDNLFTRWLTSVSAKNLSRQVRNLKWLRVTTLTIG
jgi:hypothetical protein